QRELRPRGAPRARGGAAMSLRPEAQSGNDSHFFSNRCKDERERWILDHWMAAKKQPRHSEPQKGEAPDFHIDGEDVEIVEVLLPGRKRHSEFIRDAKEIQAGNIPVHDPCIELSEVKALANSWVL